MSPEPLTAELRQCLLTKLLSVRAGLTSDFITSQGSYRLTTRRPVQRYEPAIFRLSCVISIFTLLQNCLNASLILSYKQQVEVKMTIKKITMKMTAL